MSRGRYNIPKQYKVEKGMPTEVLYKRIENSKCRGIFQNGVESITWSYQITDDAPTSDVTALMRSEGISVFEVVTKTTASPELLTEVFAALIPKRSLIVYLCGDELAMGVFIPNESGKGGRMCATDFFPYDSSRMIEVLDYERDCDKSYVQIHNRLLATIRQNKRIIMIEKAFESIQNKKKAETEANFDFSAEALNKIREDARYVEEQLKV